jgi:hypothetical protein
MEGIVEGIPGTSPSNLSIYEYSEINLHKKINNKKCYTFFG